MSDEESLEKRVENQAKRMQKAERERQSLLSESVYVGTLGLMLVLPPVAGAYLGRWLDGLSDGYSMRWTISLILVGVFVGVVNVYLNIRGRP